MSTVTPKKLAEQLSLSVSTVSRSLSNNPDIGEATKARVQTLARQLHYEPNFTASSLRRKKTNSIGVIIPEVANSFLAEAVNGIEKVARKHGYQVVINLTRDNPLREAEMVHHLLNGRVDGLLISVSRGDQEDVAHLARLHERKIPLVFFDRVCEQLNAAQVTTDDYHSGYLATQHLLEAGCRRIAYLQVSNDLSIGRRRRLGYCAALQAAGIPADPHLVLNRKPATVRNVVAIKQLLRQSEERIDGVFASVEDLVIDTYTACQELGLRIPQDVKVIGFSNMPVAALLAPPLTTITQPAYNIGATAATILINALKSKRPTRADQSRELASQLQVRGSTAG